MDVAKLLEERKQLQSQLNNTTSYTRSQIESIEQGLLTEALPWVRKYVRYLRVAEDARHSFESEYSWLAGPLTLDNLCLRGDTIHVGYVDMYDKCFDTQLTLLLSDVMSTSWQAELVWDIATLLDKKREERVKDRENQERYEMAIYEKVKAKLEKQNAIAV